MSAVETIPGRELPEVQTAAPTDVTVSASNLPAIISAHDFLQQDYPEPAELVAGLIHRGTQTLFAGGAKSFKTWTLLSLGVCVASGTPFWGRKTTQGRVLYVNLEIDPPFFHKRLRLLSRLFTGEERTLGSFDIWNLRGHAADIATLAPEIIQRCKGEGYSLIIPDPIYQVLGGRNENSAGEMAEVLKYLDEISLHSDAAIVYGHHFAKGNASEKEQLDRASGSGVFARAADGFITLTKHKDHDNFVVEATLRNFAPIKPFGVRWEYPVLLLDETIDVTKLKKTGGRRVGHTTSDIVAVLEAGMTKPEWKVKAMTETGVSRATFYELAGEAEKSGEAVRKPDGTWARVIPSK